jgi:hypothetical protein
LYPFFIIITRGKRPRRMRRLAAQSQPLDNRVVSFDILAFQIIEQLPSLSDQFEQPSSGMVILLVRLEMIGEIADSFTEKSNLNLGRSGIRRMHPEIVDYFFLLLWGHYHG